jgi:hypothetical protein
LKSQQPQFGYMFADVHIVNIESIPASEIRVLSEVLEDKLQYLTERSLQLQDYSRLLKERSREINRRIQACVNSKQAA